MRSPAASWDVYVGVAPRTREEGTKDAIEEIWAAFVDIDDAGGAGRLATFELPPSLVVASGSQGHLHAYWPLEEPATPVQIEAINRALAERLGGDTAASTPPG